MLDEWEGSIKSLKKSFNRSIDKIDKRHDEAEKEMKQLEHNIMKGQEKVE